MGKLVSLLLLVAVCWAGRLHSKQPIQIDPRLARVLISNDFESGSEEPWYDNSPSTVHWVVEDYSSQTGVDYPTPKPVNGNKYLKTQRDASSTSGLVVLRSATFTALPGDQFSFQFWIQSRFTEGNNLDLILVENNVETLLLSLSKYSTSVNFEWRPASVLIPVTKSTEVTLVFYGYCGSNPQDAIALDDFLIESTLATTTTTTTTTRTSTPTTTRSTAFTTTTTTTTTQRTTTSTSEVCGGYYASDTGTISSPNYPNPYGYNEECRYTIQSSSGGTIKLEFLDFNTEGGFDYVTIYDGLTTDSPVLLRASGYSTSSVFTRGPACLVVHTSDSKNSLTGWSAEYTVLL